MDKQYISKLQEKVISLLRLFEKSENKPLNLLVNSTCSEVSRLMACWVLTDFPNFNTLIAKGENILNNDKLCHDVLLVKNGNKVTIIDPTIWQIFLESSNIFVGETRSTKEALALLTGQYQGNWKISETITLVKYPKIEQEKLRKVIIGTVTFNE